MDAIRWIPLIPPFTWVHLIMHLLQLFSPPWCHQVYTFDKKKNWLVVSTHLKSINQNGNLPQVGMKIKKKMKPTPRQKQAVFMWKKWHLPVLAFSIFLPVDEVAVVGFCLGFLGFRVVEGEEGFLGNPKDSVWEDWGTLGNIREDQGNHRPLKNPIRKYLKPTTSHFSLTRHQLMSFRAESISWTLLVDCWTNLS